MITLEDFLDLSMDSFYKINIFYNNIGIEILHQVEVADISDELEKLDMVFLMTNVIASWDINENNEFTINIG